MPQEHRHVFFQPLIISTLFFLMIFSYSALYAGGSDCESHIEKKKKRKPNIDKIVAELERRNLAEQELLTDELGLERSFGELEDLMIPRDRFVGGPDTDISVITTIEGDPDNPQVDLFSNVFSGAFVDNQVAKGRELKRVWLETMDDADISSPESGAGLVVRGRVVQRSFRVGGFSVDETIGLFNLSILHFDFKKYALHLTITHVRKEPELNQFIGSILMRNLATLFAYVANGFPDEPVAASQ